jgi:carboxyl-terminal processing protease
MNKLLDSNVDGLILDLRGNGGWFLEEAVTISWWFVPKWELVLRAEYAQFSDDVYRAKWPSKMSWLPLVVLVDDLTASSWEIIALALRERAWAKIVGVQTFGKWTVQTLHEFPDRTSLKYTVGQWFSPDDTMIDKVWVTPDVVVEFDEDLYLTDYRDNQEESAKRTLVELIEVQ